MSIRLRSSKYCIAKKKTDVKVGLFGITIEFSFPFQFLDMLDWCLYF
jgi:hypothetical protein